MKDKLISAITFCKRIHKLTLGHDLVKNALMTGEACLVLLASDLSPKSRKEAEFLCEEWDVPCLNTDLTLDEYWYLVGKRAGIIAVTDPVFAEKITAILNQ
ncbi:MAG: L7Ae/L30e/S12e/Gadd45 family ribosomal protein [Massiliimalia sp.]|jgi:ribosomal protein L7Ae-like RNA K-turn-binding protein